MTDLSHLRADYDLKTHLSKFAGPKLGKTQAEWKRLADEAFRKLREAMSEKMVPREPEPERLFPLGFAYENATEIVIAVSVSWNLPDTHDCDVMGCGSMHVVQRIPLSLLAAPCEVLKNDARELFEYRKRELYQLMSDISEDCFCAGWMHGNEFRLWQVITDPNDDRRYGMGEICHEHIERLRALSQAVNGWWVWEHDAAFISHDEWKRRLAAIDSASEREGK